jgi:hypothetical protein
MGRYFLILLLAGCVSTHPSAPRLTADQVVHIAEKAANTHGYNLDHYVRGVARFRGKSWSVFFSGKTGGIGNNFLVVVDDRTRFAELHPGR